MGDFFVKRLERDVEMYEGAVTDLERHGEASADIIQALTTKANRTKQVLNMVSGPCTARTTRDVTVFVRTEKLSL